MLGAIIGDIVGSRFEWHNYLAKDFAFFHKDCFFTDDSIMSLAICKAIMESRPDYEELGKNTVTYMQQLGRRYPKGGYGGMFRRWLRKDAPEPYGSFGNGAAMRVSACGYAANSVEEAKVLSKQVTEVTHNHPEGVKGAEAVVVAIVLARQGKSMEELEAYIDKYYYPMNFTLDEIRPHYEFDASCQGTVPQALKAFFESVSFEDAIRKAISIGGDSDTLGAITGSVAEAYYGIPYQVRERGVRFLDHRLFTILQEFEEMYPPAGEKGENLKLD